MRIEDFDPNGVGVSNGNYFGLPFDPEDCRLVLISVPWDVTTSYCAGTSKGPDAIMDASLQCDLYDFHNTEGWKQGIGTIEIDESLIFKNKKLREDAEKVIDALSDGKDIDNDNIQKRLRKVNEGSDELNCYVYCESKNQLDKNKIAAVVGGEHSVPYGLIKALGEKYESFGILHLDAHADLREAYEGFTFSHASIMYNVLKDIPQVTNLVQVAVRDTCEDEVNLVKSDGRITCFYDHELSKRQFEGEKWGSICEEIVSHLPENVYISFDIDSLSPDNCPNTGTPVPGGISYNQAVYLLAKTVEAGKKIIGFDLCEVAPTEDNEWNQNVGARILYKLCNLTLKSASGDLAPPGINT